MEKNNEIQVPEALVRLVGQQTIQIALMQDQLNAMAAKIKELEDGISNIE